MADNEAEAAPAPTDKEKDNKSNSYLLIFWINVLNFSFFYFTVCILLNATGNVPIIKKRTWTVDPYKTVSWIQKFIHKYLKLDPSEQIVSWSLSTYMPYS